MRLLSCAHLLTTLFLGSSVSISLALGVIADKSTNDGNSFVSPAAQASISDEQKLQADELVGRARTLINDRQSSSRINEAVTLLEKALELRHPKAAIDLAKLYFFGRTNWEPDHEKSVVYLDQCEDAECHFMLAVCHFFALGGKTFSPHHSLAYLASAAEGGNTAAGIAMGHAYSQGQWVSKSCVTARDYYFPVATEMARKLEESRQRPSPKLARLTWDQTDRQGQNTQDVIDFYNFNSDPRDANSMLFLGQVYYLGIGGMERDFSLAREYFERAADLGNSTAEGYLGQMDFYGEGIPAPNFREAYNHFRKSARAKGPVGQNGMGLLYWKGIEVVQDTTEAIKYFKLAAEQDHSEASYNLGRVLYQVDRISNEDKIFGAYLSALRGGFLLAGYELAKMNMEKDLTCSLARFLLQNMLEKHEVLLIMEEAHDFFFSGKHAQALSRYLYCATMGLEVAQYNAAFCLEAMTKGEKENPTSLRRRALFVWSLAAEHGDVNSIIRLGDYFYYGWGLEQAEPITAAAYYHKAIEKKSSLAAYNLGYLHERGIGVPRDYHMAKKYYERALTYSKTEGRPEAWLPILCSLNRLLWKSRWQTWRNSMSKLPRWVLPFVITVVVAVSVISSLLFYMLSNYRRRTRRAQNAPMPVVTVTPPPEEHQSPYNIIPATDNNEEDTSREFDSSENTRLLRRRAQVESTIRDSQNS